MNKFSDGLEIDSVHTKCEASPQSERDALSRSTFIFKMTITPIGGNTRSRQDTREAMPTTSHKMS